jgi:HlyD family secretion protein
MIASPSARLARFVSPRWPGPLPLVIGLVALALVLGLAWIGYRTLSAPRPAGPPAEPFPVLRGPISSSVGATGAVAATRQAKLSFRVGGTIEEIAVAVGDRVTAGQPLARLGTDALQAKVEQARSQLADAQLKLQELLDGATPEELAAAQAAYDAAAAKLADLEASPSAADLESAMADVAAAQGQYDQARLKLRGIGGSGEPVAAQAAVDSAQAALTSAEAKLEQVRGGAAPDELAAARAAVGQARGSLRAAEAKLAEVKAGSTQAELATAQAAFDQARAGVTAARAKLDQARATQPVPADVAQAQAALAAAESKLHAAHQKLGQLSDQLAAARAKLAAQESELRAARQSADATCSKLGGSSAECATAKARVDQLEPEILETEQEIKQLRGSGSWEQLAAQKEVRAAQAAYDAAAADLQQVQASRQVAADLVTAQTSYDAALAQLTSARARLDEVRGGPKAAELVSAQTAVESARASLAGAEAKLRTVEQGPTPADLAAAESTAEAARANLATAQAKLAAVAVSSSVDLESQRAAVASAEAGLRSARAKLEQVRRGATQAELQQARSALAAAQATLVAKAGGAKASEVARQQETIRQQELALEQAERDLAAAVLTAPFDGVVAAVSASVGDSVGAGASAAGSGSGGGGGGAAITLVDPKAARVEVAVNEADVTKLQPGRPASITLDALPGQQFSGTLLSIAPTGTSSNGVVTYSATLSIDTRGQVLPAGLTAAAKIVAQQKDDALLVPSRLVQRDGDTATVNVAGPDGTPVPRRVRTGIADAELTEIVDGLKEDEGVLPPAPAEAPGGLAGSEPRENVVQLAPGEAPAGGGPGVKVFTKGAP